MDNFSEDKFSLELGYAKYFMNYRPWKNRKNRSLCQRRREFGRV
jgi:hypothetical protein